VVSRSEGVIRTLLLQTRSALHCCGTTAENGVPGKDRTGTTSAQIGGRLTE